jgi:pimeloyl-ACP methyl ester carboxylesterase
VRRPVLVLAGTEDRVLPSESMSERIRRLRLTDVEFRPIAGGHMLLHEQPAATARTIVDWLGGLGP